MWNGYCGNLIRRTNRNQLIVLLAVAALIGSVLYARWYYFNQFFRGTSSADVRAVAQHPREDQFVRVRIDQAFYAGLQHTTTKNGATEVDSQYFLTEAGDKLLILRVPGEGHPLELDNFTIEGRVRPLPDDLSAILEKSRQPNFPHFSPYYIDAEDYRGVGVGLIIIGVLALLFWVWLLWRYLPGAGDFSRHFFARRISKYGPLESLVPEIDMEVAAADAARSGTFGNLKITRNWLITGGPFDANAIRLNHLVWAHPYQVNRKLYYLITVARYYYLKAYDDLGKEVEVRLKKPVLDAALRELAGKCSQTFFGYHQVIEKLWKRLRNRGQSGRFLEEAHAILEQPEPKEEKVG
jgi:hypothetical protein